MRNLTLKLLPMTTAVLMLMLFTAGTSAATTTTEPTPVPIGTHALIHRFSSPPSWWVSSALCVHGYEGSWTDPNAPFWGGMQMDYQFQKDYGLWALQRWGTADRWPVWAQLQVAYEGWKHRGWWPWPNTARYCGLL